ncbi:MAG: choice-of-anchor J domain-containing protein [Deltaproteobacteria bacterium]|nr:choice-of-anchor J domain-containing protein [Deltaproteobacteria bacterium]
MTQFGQPGNLQAARPHIPLMFGRLAGVVLCLAALAGCSDTVVQGPDTQSDSQVPADTATPDSKTDTAKVDTADPDAKPTDTDPGDTDSGDSGDGEPADAADSLDDTIEDTVELDGGDGESTDAVATDTALPDSSPDSTPDTTSPIVPGVFATACSTNGDCVNSCAVGATCEAGTCKYTVKSNACLYDLGGGQVECMGVGDISTKKPCLACQMGPKTAAVTSNLWLRRLDGPGEGVDIVDIFKTGLTWNYSKVRSMSGGTSLYFGDPAKVTYNNNKQVGGTATLPTVKVPNKPGLLPKLNFWLWLATEKAPGDDLLTVRVLGGETPVKVWTSDTIGGSTGGVWLRIAIELKDYVGQSVQFQFAFETKDGIANAYEGVYVDDVAISTGCCANVAECDDGNACSTDLCQDGEGGVPVCTHSAKADCCSTNAQCSDGKPCTLDLCSGPGGTCTHSDVPNCCLADSDCDDKNDCTFDQCPAAGGSCTHANTCCKTDAECAVNDPCKKGICASGICAEVNLCCAFESECDDQNPCTGDACDKGKCLHTALSVPGCCAPSLLNSVFSGSDEGFTTISTKPELGWTYKELANAHSAPGALHMGNLSAATMSVPNSPTWKVTAVSPTFTVLAGKETTLSFWAFAPSGAYSSYTLRAYALVDGSELTFVNISGFTLANTWKQYTFDLTPLGGKSFDVRFEYKPSTASGTTTGPGMYIDDISVSSTCKAKPCASAANCPVTGLSCLTGVCSDGVCSYANNCCTGNGDCNDNNLCTTDSCGSSKLCSFAPIKGCCMGPGDCNDNNACTENVCPGPGGQCNNPAIPGCCLSSAQCDDKNACTVDSCISNKCVNQNSCCTADKDCADGETTCTIDKCVNSKCAHTPTGAPGCCQPDVWSNDFDGGDIKGITLNNSAGPSKGWQLTTAQPSAISKTAPGVLYYGDTNAGNFDFGATNGTATTPKVQLPADTPSKLTFDVYMDTESSTSYDNLTVTVLVGTQKLTAFTKNASGFSISNWYSATFDLANYKGQEVQVQFKFDTGDSVGNSGKGVFIDNLKLTTNCGG